MKPENYDVAVCGECESEYYRHTSQMVNLCPECASILYGYTPCEHVFVNGRCQRCYWNGEHSEYVDSIIKRN